MEAKHTPGPWTAAARLDYGFNVRAVSSEGVGYTVAENITSIPTATLIAAAPEMLETLREVLKQCRNAAELGATGPGFYEDLIATVTPVLAKAEGRS
jgi:hypothetical protein